MEGPQTFGCQVPLRFEAFQRLDDRQCDENVSNSCSLHSPNGWQMMEECHAFYVLCVRFLLYHACLDRKLDAPSADPAEGSLDEPC